MHACTHTACVLLNYFTAVTVPEMCQLVPSVVKQLNALQAEVNVWELLDHSEPGLILYSHTSEFRVAFTCADNPFAPLTIVV